MRRLILAAAIAALSGVTLAGPAIAGGADGVWKTEANKKGGYLEVTVAPCKADAAKTCGIITAASSATGPDPAYANLGKPIIENMASSDGTSFSGGTIWDPEDGKTYASKMILKGDTLDVEGCVGPICRGQDWERVQ
jgi:uncharacterized protein (DUF2147 family)